ncbi:MAG: hypothetical protein IH898_05050 [Planctomycetes bacterium]|nr:hypothetical protein [Planctomycetota bacterium]
MPTNRRILTILLLCGITLFLASFWAPGISHPLSELTTEKAEEIQQARLDYHRLSHEHAEHADGHPEEKHDDAELLAAEKNFYRLHHEIESIRNARPWVTSMLRYGGLVLFVVSGSMLGLEGLSVRSAN